MTTHLDDISLQDTMNQMARRMERLQDHHEKKYPAQQVPQELKFWIRVDPLMAELYKLLVDARANRGRIKDRHGVRDPLGDVADDMVDSAASAVETRLIELRRDAEANSAVAAMMQAEDDAAEEAEIAAEREHSARFWKDLATPRGRPIKTQAEDSFLMVFASMMVLRQSLDRAQHALSIATVFGRATANNDLHFRQARHGTV